MAGITGMAQAAGQKHLPLSAAAMNDIRSHLEQLAMAFVYTSPVASPATTARRRRQTPIVEAPAALPVVPVAEPSATE